MIKKYVLVDFYATVLSSVIAALSEISLYYKIKILESFFIKAYICKICKPDIFHKLYGNSNYKMILNELRSIQ